jgi:hypothetical protein
MYKRLIKAFLIVPFLMAFQCEDDIIDSGFETTYIIQNETDIDLFLLTEQDVFFQIASQSSRPVNSELNSETRPIEPSKSLNFSRIKLYKLEGNDYILVYEQTPIDDNLWVFNELEMNKFEYILVITDQLIN